MAPIATTDTAGPGANPNPKAMFSNEGVAELIPPPAFDYRTYELRADEVHSLIGRVTEALINIKDETGRFSYRSKYGQWAKLICSPVRQGY